MMDNDFNTLSFFIKSQLTDYQSYKLEIDKILIWKMDV